MNAATWMPNVHMVHDEVMRNEMTSSQTLDAKSERTEQRICGEMRTFETQDLSRL